VSQRNSVLSTCDLPAIPDKRYFTIGEVGELCQLKSHVLRYWEQEFPELSPTKRRGNRRYYRAEDVALIRTIRALLYEKGFTLQGARSQLKSDKKPAKSTANPTIQRLIDELKSLQTLLEPVE
jgi:DNA-binding transcriptional MerR regulator